MAKEINHDEIKNNLQQYKNKVNNEAEKFKKLIDDYLDNNEEEIIEKLQEAFNKAALKYGSTTIMIDVTYYNNFDRTCPNTCKIKFDRELPIKEFTNCEIPRGKEEECILYAIEKLNNMFRRVPFTSNTSKKVIKPNISKPAVRDATTGTYIYGHFDISIDLERL